MKPSRRELSEKNADIVFDIIAAAAALSSSWGSERPLKIGPKGTVYMVSYLVQFITWYGAEEAVPSTAQSSVRFFVDPSSIPHLLSPPQSIFRRPFSKHFAACSCVRANIRRLKRLLPQTFWRRRGVRPRICFPT